MSRRRSRDERAAPAARPAVSGKARPEGIAPISRQKQAAFLAITLLLPLLLLIAVEGGLRLFSPNGGMPLFVDADFAGPGFRVASQDVARRYFPAEEFPPSPPPEPFAVEKPAGGMRIFVLGESAAAGFPFPHNGTFSRVLRDALHDVLPDAPVEVVNLGIAATNSFTLFDIIDEVIDQRPDAVLIYAGHNEYYGALGVGSTQSGIVSPAVKRFYLRLLHLRTVQLLRSGVVALRGGRANDQPEDRADAATMMEVVARDQQIELGGESYKEGLRQFAENLALVIARCERAGIPVFVASQSSNVRDQAPLYSPANSAAGGADSVFAAATRALAEGDSATARELFVRARDMDVVRFRAPSELNEVVRRAVSAGGARYVPVSESFDGESSGMPGSALFLEHVHPTQAGQLLIARTFFEALREASFVGRAARMENLRSWAEYERRMTLTPFDMRVAEHTLRTLATQWPFVSPDQASDYRGSYRPTSTLDSIALVVSRGGMPWGAAKLQLAAFYEESGAPDSAAAEYRGLARDAPFAELPQRMLGRALLEAGDPSAEAALERAFELEPTAYSGLILGRMAVERQDFTGAVRYLEAAARLSPRDPVALYSLSLAYAMSRDLARARTAAEQLQQLAPDFPGLAEWRREIGLAP